MGRATRPDANRATLPARRLAGLAVVGPRGNRIGYVAFTVKTVDGRRLAVIDRCRPRWQRLLTRTLIHARPSPHDSVISIDDVQVGEDGAVHVRGDRPPQPFASLGLVRSRTC